MGIMHSPSSSPSGEERCSWRGKSSKWVGGRQFSLHNCGFSLSEDFPWNKTAAPLPLDIPSLGATSILLIPNTNYLRLGGSRKEGKGSVWGWSPWLQSKWGGALQEGDPGKVCTLQLPWLFPSGSHLTEPRVAREFGICFKRAMLRYILPLFRGKVCQIMGPTSYLSEWSPTGRNPLKRTDYSSLYPLYNHKTWALSAFISLTDHNTLLPTKCPSLINLIE